MTAKKPKRWALYIRLVEKDKTDLYEICRRQGRTMNGQVRLWIAAEKKKLELPA